MLVLALIVLGATSAACGGATGSTAAGSTVVLGQSDAGRTIQVRTGDTIKVTLQEDFPVPGSSLVWDVSSLDTSVLQAATVTRSPQVRSGPGGQDTYTAEFRAVASGQAALDAHGTTSCEAMAKQFCPDRDFTITVVVSSGAVSSAAG
jgi:predicted secreted protein